MILYLLGLIIIVYLINRFALSYGFKNLKYDMEIEKDLVEIGEAIEIKSIIKNEKFLNVSFLKVDEKFPDNFSKIRNVYTLFLRPYEKVTRRYNVDVKKRGSYLIKDVNLEIGDFIGLYSVKENISLNKEIIVLPEKLDIQENLLAVGSLNGDISVKRWILDDPLMAIGIRDYTGNEPERFIHWPSSLKYGNLMVKNFDFTSDNSVIVILNTETMKPSWKKIEEDLIEKVISLSRTLVEEFESFKTPYGFATNAVNLDSSVEKGYYYHPGLGSDHLNNILMTLGKIDYKLPSFFGNTLKDIVRKQGNYATAVIITPRILDTYIDPINSLSLGFSRTIVISLEEDYLDHLNHNIIKYRGN